MKNKTKLAKFLSEKIDENLNLEESCYDLILITLVEFEENGEKENDN